MATELQDQLAAAAHTALCDGELVRADHLCRSLIRLNSTLINSLLSRSCQIADSTTCLNHDGAYQSRSYLASAIISTYNAERFLEQRLVNLLEQSIGNELEILVIDSASSQNEQEIVRSFQSRYSNIRYFRTSRRESIYQAWNRAVSVARGTYLTNANCDDRLRSDALEIMISALQQGYDVAYADSLLTWGENQSFTTHTAYDCTQRPTFTRNALLENCITGSHPLWRAELHERYGGFDPAYTSAGDYEFFIRAATQSTFIHIPEPLGLVWTSPDTFSGKGLLPNMEFYAVRERYHHLLAPTGADRPLTTAQLQTLDQTLSLLGAGEELSALDGNLEGVPRLCYEIGMACEHKNDVAGAWRYLQRAYYLAPENHDYRTAMERVLRNSLHGSIMALASENSFLISSNLLMTAALAAQLCSYTAIATWLYVTTLEQDPANTPCATNLTKLLHQSSPGGRS